MYALVCVKLEGNLSIFIGFLSFLGNLISLVSFATISGLMMAQPRIWLLWSPVPFTTTAWLKTASTKRSTLNVLHIISSTCTYCPFALTSERSSQKQIFVIEWICLVRDGCQWLQSKWPQLSTEVPHGTSLLVCWCTVVQVARLFGCIHSIWVVLCSNIVSADSIAICKSPVNAPSMATGTL